MAVTELTNSGYPAPDFATYTAFDEPQCTWYAHGRMREIGGVDIAFTQDYNLHGKNWWYYVSNLERSYSPGTKAAIACFSGPTLYGHVAFVYGLQGDTILFSESNTARHNTKVYRCTKSEFEGLYTGFLGYLTIPRETEYEDLTF